MRHQPQLLLLPFSGYPLLIAEIITSYTDRLIEEYPTISTLDECCEMAFRYALRNRSAVMYIYTP